MKKTLFTLTAGILASALPTFGQVPILYDMTNNGIGQDLEDTVPNSTGTQTDGIFTTTLSLPSPGGEANGDGFGPASGDANEFDDNEIAGFSITLDSISTSAPAASFVLTGLDFDGVGENAPTGFEYFIVSSSQFTTLRLVDADVTDATITNEGFVLADFTRLASGDEITGLALSLGTLNVGDSTDLSFEFQLSPNSTGNKGSLAGISMEVTAVPEPASFAALAGLLMLGFVVVRRRLH